MNCLHVLAKKVMLLQIIGRISNYFTAFKTFALYEIFFLLNNVTIVTTQDSYLITSCLRVTLEAFSNVT